MNPNNIQFDISWNTLWKILLFVGFVFLIYFSRHAIGVLFVGVVVSLGLEPIVEYLERKGINRILGAILTFSALISVFVASIWLIVPIVTLEMGTFFTQINESISHFVGLELLPESVIDDITANLVQMVGAITSPGVITGAITSFISNVVIVVSTVVISFYLLIEKNGTERMIRIILPNKHEGKVLTVFSHFKEKIRVWLIAQLALSVMVGTLVGVGLFILDLILPISLEHIFIIALLAAVFEIVPVVGPILSGFIAFLVTAPTNLVLALFVVGVFFIVQQIESNILTPAIMRKAMRIHPILVLVALIAGGHAAGFVGVILAVPVALLAQEMFNYMAGSKNHSSPGLGI